MVNREELRRLAQAVDGWSNCNKAWLDTSEDTDAAVVGHINEDGNTYPVATVDCEQYYSGDSLPLAKFYAAANPATVLSLLDEIELIQSEVNEQARLLGMSAERELKLLAEIERLRAELETEKEWVKHYKEMASTLNEEVERLRAEIETREDGSEKMALKGIEMRNEIQRLINERNAFGLAIDRALTGIVPDEHPLRSRLVEIAAMRAQTAQTVPVAWRIFDGEGGYDYCSFADNEALRDEFIKRNGEKYASWVEPLYLAPSAQTAPSVQDGWRPIETAPKDGTHVLLANKAGTRVASGAYGNYDGWAWAWPYVMVEPAYWRPVPAVPYAQENNDG